MLASLSYFKPASLTSSDSVSIWCKRSKRCLFLNFWAINFSFSRCLLCKLLKHWAANWRKLERYDLNISFFCDETMWQVLVQFREFLKVWKQNGVP